MVIHDVVVDDHAVRIVVGRVLAAGSFNVVDLRAVGHVDELETVASSDPNHVLTNVGSQTSHVVVATVEYAVVLREGHQPLVGGDVVAEHAKALGADVSDVAHDLDHGVARLGALAPVLIVLEIGFCDEAHA